MKKNLNVGSKIKQKSGQWSFKNSIVKNFEKHIDQSIPYYKSNIYSKDVSKFYS